MFFIVCTINVSFRIIKMREIWCFIRFRVSHRKSIQFICYFFYLTVFIIPSASVSHTSTSQIGKKKYQKWHNRVQSSMNLRKIVYCLYKQFWWLTLNAITCRHIKSDSIPIFYDLTSTFFFIQTKHISSDARETSKYFERFTKHVSISILH